MLKVRRLAFTSGLFALVASLGMIGTPIAQAQDQVGLVNVTIGDVLSHNNVNIAVAANVAATVCGQNIQVGVLAQQIQRQGSFKCTSATGKSVLIQKAG
jgi:hypothetical protein